MSYLTNVNAKLVYYSPEETRAYYGKIISYNMHTILARVISWREYEAGQSKGYRHVTLPADDTFAEYLEEPKEKAAVTTK